MLKCQFHCHAKGDLLDDVRYTPKALIKEAARLNYDVICITAHRTILFNKDLKRYANKLGVLLIPGIEFEVNGKHTLGINAHSDLEKVRTINDLRTYRQNHPETFIIAAHPFFYPPRICHHQQLLDNLELFDAIEHSYFYTKKINFNKKAIATAKKHQKALVSTADCHLLKHLDIGYSYLDANKNLPSVMTALRQGKIKMHTQPLSLWKMIGITIQLFMMEPLGFLRLFKRH